MTWPIINKKQALLAECKICGIEFSTTVGNKVVCSKKCTRRAANIRTNYYRKKGRRKKLQWVETICRECQTPFCTTVEYKCYCSLRCKIRALDHNPAARKRNKRWRTNNPLRTNISAITSEEKRKGLNPSYEIVEAKAYIRLLRQEIECS